ncbi:MAG: bifunctional UDP-3-O-[3-hydroxymyristoyl] N-acetylglucosamine deacetylase/3-hydroxyacyl-ACP dehydratase [Bacteroidales bacterium]
MGGYQQTLSEKIEISGKGLHTGQIVTIVLKSAPINSGIKFRRVDIEGCPTIDALVSNVTFTERGTLLTQNGFSISTVEHLLSALFAYGIDNAIIDVDGGEIPILDGSSLQFASLIANKIKSQRGGRKKWLEIKEPLHIKDSKSGSSISIYPNSSFEVEVVVDFNSKVIAPQSATYSEKIDYFREIAPARTFIFAHDLIPLLKAGLIKGGEWDNAVVIAEREIEGEELEQLKQLFDSKNLLERIERGFVNVDSFHFENELARHKLLDLLGDFALLGRAIKGRVVAYKPGHKINTDITKKLLEMVKTNEQNFSIPKYDPNEPAVVDINGIKDLLPHRPPFLMVDRIISMERERVVGIKTVGINEGFFIGHFPDEPVMPGVLIIEAMAQVGGILVLSDIEEPEKHSTYFAKIDNAKFKRKVVPGDVLTIVLEITMPLRRSIVAMKGRTYVGDTLACEADLVAQVIKNR